MVVEDKTSQRLKLVVAAVNDPASAQRGGEAHSLKDLKFCLEALI